MKKTTTRIGSFLLMLVMLAGLLPVIAAPASAYTLQEKRQAVIQTAWAYYDKGRALQYDSIDLSIVPKTDFGPLRVTYEVTPEYATPDETMFSRLLGLLLSDLLQCLRLQTQTASDLFLYRRHCEDGTEHGSDLRISL